MIRPRPRRLSFLVVLIITVFVVIVSRSHRVALAKSDKPAGKPNDDEDGNPTAAPTTELQGLADELCPLGSSGKGRIDTNVPEWGERSGIVENGSKFTIQGNGINGQCKFDIPLNDNQRQLCASIPKYINNPEDNPCSNGLTTTTDGTIGDTRIGLQRRGSTGNFTVSNPSSTETVYNVEVFHLTKVCSGSSGNSICRTQFVELTQFRGTYPPMHVEWHVFNDEIGPIMRIQYKTIEDFIGSLFSITYDFLRKNDINVLSNGHIQVTRPLTGTGHFVVENVSGDLHLLNVQLLDNRDGRGTPFVVQTEFSGTYLPSGEDSIRTVLHDDFKGEQMMVWYLLEGSEVCPGPPTFKTDDGYCKVSFDFGLA
jgi:hypothetical protein